MPTLQEVVQNHLELEGKSIRALAKDASITYPTLLGVVNRGSVPRKAEHREALREILEIDEEDWADILLASTTNGLGVEAGKNTVTLQQMVSQKMYSRGMTEQDLAEAAEVAYSTVMGITRKGSIPREESLNSVIDILGLDPDEVRQAVGASRALRRSGGTDVYERPTEVIGLAQVVAKHIRSRGQSAGSFAQDLGIGYFVISKFLATGVPPEDESHLEALRKMLDLGADDFKRSLEQSQEAPEPADLGPQDELLGDNANPLQEAMVSYMRDHSLTLKALAKRADLSQVTVSRLVKQGQSPTRATTHIKLQELLGLSPERYQSLTTKCQPASNALMSKESADEYEPDDGYEPHQLDEMPFDTNNPPTKDELIALVKKLGPKQREALKTFLAAMV